MVKLTKEEVNSLHLNYPEIEDPTYPKNIIEVFENDDCIFEMDIDGEIYIVETNPILGRNMWFKERKYEKRCEI